MSSSNEDLLDQLVTSQHPFIDRSSTLKKQPTDLAEAQQFNNDPEKVMENQQQSQQIQQRYSNVSTGINMPMPTLNQKQGSNNTSGRQSELEENARGIFKDLVSYENKMLTSSQQHAITFINNNDSMQQKIQQTLAQYNDSYDDQEGIIIQNEDGSKQYDQQQCQTTSLMSPVTTQKYKSSKNNSSLNHYQSIGNKVVNLNHDFEQQLKAIVTHKAVKHPQVQQQLSSSQSPQNGIHGTPGGMIPTHKQFLTKKQYFMTLQMQQQHNQIISGQGNISQMDQTQSNMQQQSLNLNNNSNLPDQKISHKVSHVYNKAMLADKQRQIINQKYFSNKFKDFDQFKQNSKVPMKEQILDINQKKLNSQQSPLETRKSAIQHQDKKRSITLSQNPPQEITIQQTKKNGKGTHQYRLQSQQIDMRKQSALKAQQQDSQGSLFGPGGGTFLQIKGGEKDGNGEVNSQSIDSPLSRSKYLTQNSKKAKGVYGAKKQRDGFADLKIQSQEYDIQQLIDQFRQDQSLNNQNATIQDENTVRPVNYQNISPTQISINLKSRANAIMSPAISFDPISATQTKPQYSTLATTSNQDSARIKKSSLNKQLQGGNNFSSNNNRDNKNIVLINTPGNDKHYGQSNNNLSMNFAQSFLEKKKQNRSLNREKSKTSAALNELPDIYTRKVKKRYNNNYQNSRNLTQKEIMMQQIQTNPSEIYKFKDHFQSSKASVQMAGKILQVHNKKKYLKTNELAGSQTPGAVTLSSNIKNTGNLRKDTQNAIQPQENNTVMQTAAVTINNSFYQMSFKDISEDHRQENTVSTKNMHTKHKNSNCNITIINQNTSNLLPPNTDIRTLENSVSNTNESPHGPYNNNQRQESSFNEQVQQQQQQENQGAFDFQQVEAETNLYVKSMQKGQMDGASNCIEIHNDASDYTPSINNQNQFRSKKFQLQVHKKKAQQDETNMVQKRNQKESLPLNQVNLLPLQTMIVDKQQYDTQTSQFYQDKKLWNKNAIIKTHISSKEHLKTQQDFTTSNDFLIQNSGSSNQQQFIQERQSVAVVGRQHLNPSDLSISNSAIKQSDIKQSNNLEKMKLTNTLSQIKRHSIESRSELNELANNLNENELKLLGKIIVPTPLNVQESRLYYKQLVGQQSPTVDSSQLSNKLGNNNTQQMASKYKDLNQSNKEMNFSDQASTLMTYKPEAVKQYYKPIGNRDYIQITSNNQIEKGSKNVQDLHSKQISTVLNSQTSSNSKVLAAKSKYDASNQKSSERWSPQKLQMQSSIIASGDSRKFSTINSNESSGSPLKNNQDLKGFKQDQEDEDKKCDAGQQTTMYDNAQFGTPQQNPVMHSVILNQIKQSSTSNKPSSIQLTEKNQAQQKQLKSSILSPDAAMHHLTSYYITSNKQVQPIDISCVVKKDLFMDYSKSYRPKLHRAYRNYQPQKYIKSQKNDKNAGLYKKRLHSQDQPPHQHPFNEPQKQQQYFPYNGAEYNSKWNSNAKVTNELMVKIGQSERNTGHGGAGSALESQKLTMAGAQPLNGNTVMISPSYSRDFEDYLQENLSIEAQAQKHDTLFKQNSQQQQQIILQNARLYQKLTQKLNQDSRDEKDFLIQANVESPTIHKLSRSPRTLPKEKEKITKIQSENIKHTDQEKSELNKASKLTN